MAQLARTSNAVVAQGRARIVAYDNVAGGPTGTGIQWYGPATVSPGERAADRMRNVMGSWPFVLRFFAVMGAWVVANSVLSLGGSGGKHGFDPYLYILLNLFLSMLAACKRRRC